MKTKNIRTRKLMRVQKCQRVNRWQQQPVFIAPVLILVMAKLGFNQLRTPSKLLERLKLHISKLTDNAYFPVTTPSVADMQTLTDELNDAIIQIKAGDKRLIPYRKTLVLQVENTIRRLSYNIQFLSGGNEEMIRSAGFDIRKGKGVTNPVGEVMHLTAEVLGGGKIKLRWRKLDSTFMNYIEVTDNPVTGTWIPIGKTGRSSFIVTGLTPGALYYFRVYGSNDLGDGNPSVPMEQRSL